MKYLNLDSDFQPLGKSIDFEILTFSGGEPHIKITPELNITESITITTRIKAFNDLGFVMVAVDALERMGIQHIELLLPYFPGARQDRLMIEGEPLTVKVYAQIINSLNLKKVTIVDPHSEVTSALVDRVYIVSNNAFVKKAVCGFENFYLVSPDGGALKKIYKTALALNGIEVIECGKTRNVETGKLSGFKVYAEDLKNKKCVVVDDICDGGGTFLGLAQELKKHGAGPLVLVVTHGIFNSGADKLLDWYDQIICTDSFSTLTDKRVTQINLDPHLLQK